MWCGREQVLSPESVAGLKECSMKNNLTLSSICFLDLLLKPVHLYVEHRPP